MKEEVKAGNKFFILSSDVFDGILNYLYSKPFSEVGSSLPQLLENVKTNSERFVLAPKVEDKVENVETIESEEIVND